MHKSFLRTAALLGALAVALGAFGAHSLRGRISDIAVNTFETGVRYHFYHVIALAMVAMLYKEFPNKWLRYAGDLFIAGKKYLPEDPCQEQDRSSSVCKLPATQRRIIQSF